MIKGLLLSIQFFSRIPINMNIDLDDKNIRSSIFFLPLVGAIIGGLGGAAYYLLSPYSKLVASFIALFITILLTGGLHIDGLSDTLDGFMSNRDRERVLEIMKDSRIGAFGVLGIVLMVSFKLIMIMSIENLPLILILSFANSRLAAAHMISSKKPARDTGLGAMFNKSNPKKMVILSGLIYAFILTLIGTNLYIFIPLLITYLFSEYMSHISYKKIGGVTGDIYGATIEIGDVISLFSFWLVMNLI